MKKIQILDSNKDKYLWRKIIESLPMELKDIYFYPEYVEMHKFVRNSKGLLFKFEENKNIWLYPFLLQPIETKNQLSKKYFDIETPYGYGGPITNCNDLKFLNIANDQFTNWCKKNNVVAEFIRFHPLINNYKWRNQSTVLEFDRETISFNLKNFDIEKPNFKSKVLNMVKRVHKAEVKIDFYSSEVFFEKFLKIYHLVMKKKYANNFYNFDKKYFNNLLSLIKETGWFIAATQKNDFLGGALFLKNEKKLHYHLSATDPNNKVPGIANALIYKAIVEGCKAKLNSLHLGGGISKDPNDLLFKFKKKMGNETNKFYIGKKIYNKRVYDILKKQWSISYPKLFSKFKDRLLCYRIITN